MYKMLSPLWSGMVSFSSCFCSCHSHQIHNMNFFKCCFVCIVKKKLVKLAFSDSVARCCAAFTHVLTSGVMSTLKYNTLNTLMYTQDTIHAVLTGPLYKIPLSISSFCTSKELMDLLSFPPLLYLTRRRLNERRGIDIRK